MSFWLHHLLPAAKPPAGQGLTLNITDGILYVLSTGCRWRDLPHDYQVSDTTCYRYFQYWLKSGKLKKIVDQVAVSGRIKRPKRLEADKGYDSNPIRQELKDRSICPCLIRRDNNQTRVSAIELRESKYSNQRWKVERSLNWPNNNRRVDRFMERSTRTYQAFSYMTFIKFYLRRLAK